MTHRLLESLALRVITITAFLVLGGGVWLARSGRAEAGGPAPSVTGNAAGSPSVQLSDAQWATLDIRTASTTSLTTLAVADAVVTVDDHSTIPMFSPATGRVVQVTVDVGQSVRRGQMLASIAGAETAQAASDFAAAAAQDRTAQRQLALSREVAARQQALVDAGGGAAKDWHQSQSDLIAAEGAKRIAGATLAAARVKASAVGIDVPTPDAGANPARLLAPIDGQIIQREVVAGQFISSLVAGGASPLFTISDLRRVWVVGSLGERDGAALRVGQAVEISTLSSTSTPLKSVISWISPTVDPQTRRIQFRSVVANLDLALKPQMTARIRVIDAAAAPSVAIASVAIIHDGVETHCYVATGPRTLTARRLQVGRTEAGLTQVLSGLKPGERVVTRGAIFVDTLAESAAS